MTGFLIALAIVCWALSITFLVIAKKVGKSARGAGILFIISIYYTVGMLLFLLKERNLISLSIMIVSLSILAASLIAGIVLLLIWNSKVSGRLKITLLFLTLLLLLAAILTPLIGGKHYSSRISSSSKSSYSSSYNYSSYGVADYFKDQDPDLYNEITSRYNALTGQ